MSISVQCPGCETELKVKDDLAGKRVKCVACGATVRVPDEQVGLESGEATSSPTEQGSRRHKPQKNRRKRAAAGAGRLRVGGFFALCLGLIWAATLFVVHYQFRPIIREVEEIDRKTAPALGKAGVDVKSFKSWGDRTNKIAHALINDPVLRENYNSALPKTSPFKRAENMPVLDTVCMVLSFSRAVPAVQECCVRGFVPVFLPGIIQTAVFLGLGGLACLWSLRAR